MIRSDSTPIYRWKTKPRSVAGIYLGLIILMLCPMTGRADTPASGGAVAEKPPNIILILTDDQGWTSMSSAMDDHHPEAHSDYHRTPHMDALAARGMRFAHGYAASPVCSPTRYSIQYGKTPARLHKTIVRGPNHVDHSQTSLPQALKSVDERYVCAHFGKWHIKVEPAQLGYDFSDGKTTNREGGFTNGKPAEWNGYSADDPKLIDHVTDRGIAFMQAQVQAGRPFFLQLSHYAVHSDIVYKEASLEDVQSREPGQVHTHAGYAAMMQDLDNGIGKLMQAYDELGLSDNTYVFFVSDNGGMPIIPPRAQGGVPYEVGLNAPLRRGKWDLTEGGIRVPFIVAGPGIQPGSQCDTPVVTYDLLPTFTDLAGRAEPLPDEFDGASMVPMLKDPTTATASRPLGDTIIFHFPHYNAVGLNEPHNAIRQGQYKLLHFIISDRSLLFDMVNDLGEQTDLADQMPERVAAMEQTLDAYLESVEAEKPEESFNWKKKGEGTVTTRFLEAFRE